MNPDQRAAVLRWLRGEAADRVAREGGVGVDDLEQWRAAHFESKLPYAPGQVEETVGGVKGAVRIARDTWGIAHVRADRPADVFFGLGYVMAQERLWQLDYQRRLVRGELAAVLGRRFRSSDVTMRTLGIGAAGDRAWETASDEVREVLLALAAGIDCWTARVGDRLPVEFELLEYQPRPWNPADSVAIWKHRWWTLTGRLEQIVVAEAARALPPELAAAFQATELDDETIVPEESLPAIEHDGSPLDEGSNNWAVGGSRTTTGAPVLCSDPHNVFNAPSQWVEAQVTCPTFDAAGAFYQGTPALYLGRNRHVAWGLTNHAISVRDLYRETTDPDHPGAYREGDTWRPFAVERHTLAIQGEPDEVLEVRSTSRGPIVNGLLAPLGVPADPPLSLRWLATEVDSGFDASLALLRATSAAEVETALRIWPCPPLNFVYADANGAIGYHAASFVPRRERPGATIRDPNDPADAWDGFIPFDELPRVSHPERGWLATANNVPTRRDPWYVRTGAWSDGYRARRIREQLTAQERLSPEEIAAVHADHVTGRGRELAPALLSLLGEGRDAREEAAIQTLRDWRGEQTLESVGASIWTAFWIEWCLSLARARFPEPLVGAVALKVSNVARLLLLGQPLPWLTDDVPSAVRAAFRRGLDALERAAGSDLADWAWGKLHRVTHPHPMSATPELAALFDTGPFPTTGGQSVRAAGFNLGVPFSVASGSTYRFMADLSRPDGLVAVQTLGQSGHLGSPHYRDQTPLWLDNHYHPFWMSESDVQAHLEAEIVIRPEANDSELTEADALAQLIRSRRRGEVVPNSANDLAAIREDERE